MSGKSALKEMVLQAVAERPVLLDTPVCQMLLLLLLLPVLVQQQ
jgi:hypothetical protein